MNKSKICFSVVMVFAAACLALQADDVDTRQLLCSGPWKFTKNSSNWETVRVFNQNGTFTTPVNAKETGHWKIAENKIVLTFADGHKDTMILPLNPEGTAALNAHGEDLTAVLQTKETASVSKPAQTPAPTQPSATGGGGESGVFGTANAMGGSGSAPPPAAAISPEMQQKASDLVKTYHNDLVFVSGKEGAGTGFIAAMGKSNFLFTNAHVAAGITNAGFKTLDDAAVQSGAASVAVGRDIFCMAQPAGGAPLEIMQDVETNAGIGDEVVVLGNAEGQGVINAITGRIVGIGADRVEVDAPFVPGNSGSPIIHLKTGKVVGVATYLVVNNYDSATNEKNAKPVIRRFGYRIDNVKQWQTVDWRSFYAQAAEMEKIETLTDDLDDFFRDLDENKGSVTPGRHTNPVIKNRIDQWLADRSGNHSAADIGMADENFLSFLKVACQSDVTAARQHMSYDYFQRELAGQQQIRDEMSKAFVEIIKDVGN